MPTRGSYELNSGAISERKDERWKICAIIISFIMIAATIAVILWIHRSRIAKGDFAGHQCGNEHSQVLLFEQLKQNVSTVTEDVTKTEPSTVTFLQAVTKERTKIVETTTMPTTNWMAFEKMTKARTITEETTTTGRSTQKTTDEATERQRTVEQRTDMWRTVSKVIKKQATEMHTTSVRTTEMDSTTQQITETQDTTDEPTKMPEMIPNRTDTQGMIEETRVMQKTNEETTKPQGKVEEMTETPTSGSQMTTSSTFELTEKISAETEGITETEIAMGDTEDKRVETEPSTSLETAKRPTGPPTVPLLRAVTEERTEMVETTTMPTSNWMAFEKKTNEGALTKEPTTMLKPTERSTEKTTNETTERQSTVEQTTEMRRTVWAVMKKQATEMYGTSVRTTEMDTTTQQITETQYTTDEPTKMQEMIPNTTDTQGMIRETTVMQETNEETTETEGKLEEMTETQMSESPLTTSSSFESTEQILEGTEGTTETEFANYDTEDKRVGTEPSTSLETMEQPTGATVAHDSYDPDPCDEEITNMRSHMNCEKNACEDFHSYACGAYGFESEEQSLEMDINQRILNQAKAHRNSSASKQLMDYYDSCMSYADFDETARLELAVASLDEIGQFHLSNSSQVEFDLTDMLYKLLAHDSAPLFDIDLEVDLVNPKELVFALRPRLRRSELYVDNRHQDCSEILLSADESSYEAAHNEYMICEHYLGLTEITDMLKRMEKVSAEMPSATEAREIPIDAELKLYEPFLLEGEVEISENYKRKKLSDWTEDLINANGECLNLTRLLSNLSGKLVEESSVLQIYFPEKFLGAVGSICDKTKNPRRNINNAFLGLYAKHLYDQFLKQPLDQEDYCMRAVKSLLEPQASELYMLSFTDEDLQKKNESVFAMFEELKETFRLEMAGIAWADEPGREKVMEKLNSLSLIVPQAALYEKNGSLQSATRWGEMILDSNFFDNTIRILKRKRELMYERWQQDPNAIEQIWTHFSAPYRTYAISIYRLNSIVLPLGAVDWALSSYDTSTYDLKLATLGNMISREMARQFDEWGLKYYRGNGAEPSFFHNDEQARISYEYYANCHRTLSGELHELGERTLNERLSDTVGLQLAYDTMMRMTSNSSSNISEEKRFFVAYAQMLCKRDRLPSSFWISLDAEEHLPPNLRTSAVLSSIKHVGQAWRCERGSSTYPQRFCSVFPKINTLEQEILDPSQS